MRKFAEVLGGMALERLRQREASGSVQEAGEFNRQIVAGAQEGIVVLDRELRYEVWNPFMEHLTGMPASEVLGRVAARLFPFLEDAGVTQMYRRSLAGERCGPLDLYFAVPETGRSGWVSDTTAPLRNATGEIIGVIETVSDIGERRRVDQSLRDSEARALRAQSIAHVGSWEMDLRTMTMWASEEAFRIFGIERATPLLPLEVVQAATLQEYRRPLADAMRRLMEGQGGYDEEFEITRANDGERRVIHSKGELVRDEDGAPAGVVGAWQDVTELEAAERNAVDAAARLLRTVEGTVAAMRSVVETRDPYTAGHQRRVTQLAVAIGVEARHRRRGARDAAPQRRRARHRQGRGTGRDPHQARASV